MGVESEKEKAYKLGLVPVSKLPIDFKCIWYYDGKMSDVIIKSALVGTYGKERVRVDHIKDGVITEGGYVNLNELYSPNEYFSLYPYNPNN